MDATAPDSLADSTEAVGVADWPDDPHPATTAASSAALAAMALLVMGTTVRRPEMCDRFRER